MTQRNELLTIGQISKLCKISIQTLRYYDKIDLLKPNSIDDMTGYRYYDKDQILTVRIIQQLKALKFSLIEIRELLVRNSLSRALEYCTLKCKEVQREIETLQQVEELLTVRTLNLQNEQNIATTIALQDMPTRTVAYTRYNSPCNPTAFSLRYNELFNVIERKNWRMVGNLLAIFWDNHEAFDFGDADIEVCIPVAAAQESSASMNLRELPGGKYVAAVHRGSYDKAPITYRKMIEYAHTNGYRFIGPAIEEYIVDISLITDTDKYVTLLQIPVEKA